MPHLHQRTHQDLKRVKKMLDNLREFKKGLLNLEIGDMVWDEENKVWLLVLEIEKHKSLNLQQITALEVSTNEKVYFPVGDNNYCFKDGGKIIKGTSA